ncbi:iron-sulfur cluster assembly accessory protein [Reichenbachiella agarivorans]|uniref:Iron-sulfur cluster assembly accessory protein n=1 Tax=Reichenbachiella agarivorans TaxID=2979464 RepID=A0ABY6CMF7_9BACT|nr:iron-sulfur cluster assembly accessory protein [Reichenbachiella agarivorans]UXP30668.1 iron-sulfur cluster assembly accessory protein [Reichenbachiella agarivorans]
MDIEPVNITTKAIAEVRNIMDNKGIPKDYSLRIGIKGGGCGALGYVIGFDKANDGDITYSQQDIPIVIDKKHVMYLIGLEVDFIEESDARGFSFIKPGEKVS